MNTPQVDKALGDLHRRLIEGNNHLHRESSARKEIQDAAQCVLALGRILRGASVFTALDGCTNWSAGSPIREAIKAPADEPGNTGSTVRKGGAA